MNQKKCRSSGVANLPAQQTPSYPAPISADELDATGYALAANRIHEKACCQRESREESKFNKDNFHSSDSDGSAHHRAHDG